MNPRAGTGLFALQDLDRNQFIGVYMGEVISEEECARRSILTEVEGRVYTFDIENDMLIDALNIGSIIRYANQDPDKNNAICRLVHLGERRFNIIIATKKIQQF